MSADSCPRCRTVHDGALDRRGWNLCGRCTHTWKPEIAGAPAGSDEYLPAAVTTGQRDQPASADTAGTPSPLGVLATVGAPATPSPNETGTARRRRGTVAATAAVTTPAADGQVSCPVCGHAIVLVGSPPSVYQTCPQCSTTFNTENGLLAANVDDGSVDDGRDWLIGRTIRGCFIDRKIGEGGMGAVYHARQLSLDRSVAVKVMPAELARNKNFIQRFEREAKSLAKINHPNILHIYDFGEDHALGIYFMIIEFVDGKDLGEILRTRRVISELEGLDILRQAMMGLEMAAEKGVIHRDIKPDNLMLSTTGICKVSDFGLAKGYGALDEVTSAGVRVGTPAFMSPEQCDGHEVDFRSDVYSLGCTAYLAFTGHLPFGGDSPFSIMLKHKTEVPVSMRTHRAEIDPRVDQLVQRMLAKRPDDRCTSLHQLIDLVEQMQVSIGGNNAIQRKYGDRPRGDSGAVRLIAEPAPAPAPRLTADLTATDGRELPAVKDIDFLTAPSAPSAASPEPARPVAVPIPLPSRPLTEALALHSPLREPQRTPLPSAEAPRVGGTTAFLAAQRKSPAKDITGRLADVRKQQRQGEAVTAENRGDALLAMGQIAAAVQEWQRAMALKPSFAQHSALEVKVANAQQRLTRRGHARGLVLLAVFVALFAINGWLATPVIHRLLAEREYGALAGLSAGEREPALAGFIARHAQPWGWYQTLYQRGYTLPTVAQAQHDLQRLRGVAPVVPVVDVPVAVSDDRVTVARLQALAGDGQTPWPQVVAEAERLLAGRLGDSGRRDVQVVADQAGQAVAAITVDLTAMRSQRAVGDHVAALALAAGFPARHPRAGVLVRQLPVAVQVAATVAGSPVPVDGLRLTVDDVAVKPAASALPGEAMLCRWLDRETVVLIGAPGFATETVVLPVDASTGAEQVRTLRVTLRSAQRWQTDLSMAGPWLLLRARSDGGLIAAAAQGVAVIGLDDGRLRGSVLRRTAIGVAAANADPLWTQALPITGDRLLMTTSDGLVLTATVGVDQGAVFDTLRQRGTAALAAAIERDSAFVAGRRLCFAVQNLPGGSRLVVLVDGEVRGQPLRLAGRQSAQVFALASGVAAVDDQALSLIDDNSQATGGLAFASVRIGPAVLAGGHLAVPTQAGVELIALPTATGPAQRVAPAGLSRLPGARLAVDGDDLLTASGNEITLHRCAASGVTLVWSATLPGRRLAAGPAGLGALALVVDDQGSVHCLRRSDGVGVHRIGHARVPALPPLAIAGSVIVLDAGGRVTAYALP